MVLESDFADDVQAASAFVLAFSDLVFDDFLVAVDDELLIERRLVLFGLTELLEGLLLAVHLLQEEEGVGNSQRGVVGEFLNAVEVHLVEELDQQRVFLAKVVLVANQTLCESVVLHGLLLEWAVVLVASLLMDFDVTVE